MLYQNVFADKSYPEIYFYTSTKDDRVHPGHARKMAKKMLDQGHKVIYYENVEGGTLLQQILSSQHI